MELLTTDSPTIWDDARHYCRLQCPDSRLTYRRLIWTILTSRGLWSLSIQRALRRNILQSDRYWTPWKAVLRLLLEPLPMFCVWFCKALVNSKTVIGSDVYLSNRGLLVLGAQTIGSGTVVHHAVTMGFDVTAHEEGFPSLDENVWIGPNCLLYGAIRVGQGATVLPNSVVGKDVPPGAIVGGNPALILAKSVDNALLRESPNYDAACLQAFLASASVKYVL